MSPKPRRCVGMMSKSPSWEPVAFYPTNSVFQRTRPLMCPSWNKNATVHNALGNKQRRLNFTHSFAHNTTAYLLPPSRTRKMSSNVSHCKPRSASMTIWYLCTRRKLSEVATGCIQVDSRLVEPSTKSNICTYFMYGVLSPSENDSSSIWSANMTSKQRLIQHEMIIYKE